MDNKGGKMTKYQKYYIGDTEYSLAELMKVAIDFGWRGLDTRIKDMQLVLADAIRFLVNKGLSVRSVTQGTAEPEVTPPKVYQISAIPKPAIPVKIDNSIMRIYHDDSIYILNTNLLGDECWQIQIFGNMGCMGCKDKNKESCCGGVAQIDGKNSIGHEIPIAILEGLRPSRRKESNIIET
jgi:hypothetical protein